MRLKDMNFKLNDMKKLTLVLVRKWFDMIFSGEKKEEYRNITKHYVSSFFDWKESEYTLDQFTQKLIKEEDDTLLWLYLKLFHDNIIFAHAYSTDRDKFEIEWDSIHIGEGRKEWGAETGIKYFVLTLGDKP